MFTTQQTVTSKQQPPPRCWSDSGPGIMIPHALECMAIATTEVGLCDRHYLEIFGSEQDREDVK